MEKFEKLTSVAAPMDMINIDTDMVIPKQFLKTIKRSGLGKHLFHEMRYDEDGNEVEDFVLNQPAYRNAKILVAMPRYWDIDYLGMIDELVPGFEKGRLPTEQFPQLEAILLWKDEQHPGTRSLEQVSAMPFDTRILEAAEAAVKVDDPVVIIYTSGTTGVPKGAMHCHRVLIEGQNRILDEEIGCPPGGPPFGFPSGLGWDTSTEAKGYDGLKELAIKLNPTVGMWDPLNIAAEVQLIYKPYLERGRKLSHLPYKVVRCAAPSELARDAGGKRAVGERQREAARACGEIVEGLLYPQEPRGKLPAQQSVPSRASGRSSRKCSIL